MITKLLFVQPSDKCLLEIKSGIHGLHILSWNDLYVILHTTWSSSWLKQNHFVICNWDKFQLTHWMYIVHRFIPSSKSFAVNGEEVIICFATPRIVASLWTCHVIVFVEELVISVKAWINKCFSKLLRI